MKPLQELMEERHKSYVAAKAQNFENASLTAQWRNANREYVLARDAQRFNASKIQEAA